MNDNQKLFFALAIVACFSLCFVPPWLGKPNSYSPFIYAGHRLIIYTGPSVMVMDNYSYRNFEEKTRFAKKLHLKRLALELSIIISISAILMTLTHTKKSNRL